MKRICLLLALISIFTLSASGCRTAGQGYPASPFNQGYAQPQYGVQHQQQYTGGGGAPGMGQPQPAIGQFGRNIGNRITNGLINRGINGLINAAF